MTHCERCGHGIDHHDDEGNCSHAVDYGQGRCNCRSFLRAERTVPELLAAALCAGPGRDASGTFYSQQQATRVGFLAEALLDNVAPSRTPDALELLEGWHDERIEGEVRWYVLSRSDSGHGFTVHLYRRNANHAGNMWSHTSVDSARDAAAKAIMKFGKDQS